MIETATAVLVAVATFGFGIVAGIVLNYYIECVPLRDQYNKLVHTLTHMKRQGFVPHYDLEQVKELDLTDGVDES